MKIADFITEAKVLVETRTPDQILMELNVINIPHIDKFLEELSHNLPTPELKKWFISRGKKYLINSEDDNSIITHFSGKAEPWMKQRQKEGVKLYRFDPSNELSTALSHVIDWIRAIHDTTTGAKASDQQSTARAKKALKGLNNTSMPQAIELSNQWLRDMNSGKETNYVRAEDEKGLVPVMAFGEYKWYKLTDQDCLDREGNVMGHCVASYGSRVESGRTVIYSLRDNNNFAHATVEVHDNKLEQVKGKRNAPPVEKYQRATVALLNTLNVPPTSSGMRDIEGMKFMYNKNNHKYGTLEDVADVVYDQQDIKIYSMGSEDEPNLRITKNNSVICRISSERYNRAVGIEVENFELMSGVDVKGANYDEPKYKLAKFITSIMPTVPESFRVGDLSKHLYVIGTSLVMVEDLGETKFTDGDDRITFVTGDDTKTLQDDELIHLHKGELTSRLKVIRDKQKVEGRIILGSDYQGIRENSSKVFAKYINSMKADDRPFVTDNYMYQKPDTFEAAGLGDISKVFDKIASVDDMAWYKIIKQTNPLNRANIHRRRFGTESLSDDDIEFTYTYLLKQGDQGVLTIDVDKDDKFKSIDVYYKDAIEQMDQKQIKNLASVFNKSGLTRYYTHANDDVISFMEENGLYFLRDKKKFTTDHSIAGDQFQHEDETFKAIKTHNHLKIYQNGTEVVKFGLDLGKMVKEFKLSDRLAMLSNVRKIADVLNHYDIVRQEQSNYGVKPDTNKKIAQAGLTYSADHGWKGMKSGPKPVETNQGEATKTINKSEYEIFRFKNDFLIKDASTHSLVATFKGWKERGETTLRIDKVKMESEKSTAWDIVADALNELNEKEGIVAELKRKHTSSGDKLDDNLENNLRSRGYTGFGHWGKITEKYPSEIISKGTGGTWVKEAFTNNVDPAIKANKLNNASTLTPDVTSDAEAIRKYDPYNRSLNEDAYTLYRRKTPVLRAYIKRGSLSAVYIIKQTNNDTTTEIIHSKETLLKYGPQIGRLLHNAKVGGGKYLSDHKVYLSKGKLKDISQNPKLAGFISGEIVYEDGHIWKKGLRWRDTEWTLTMTNNSGTKVELVNVEISDDGIESIKFSSPEVRKRTKLYRAFLNDIMDINDEIYGSD